MVPDEIVVEKALLEEVVNMLMKLLNHLQCRVKEDATEYHVEED